MTNPDAARPQGPTSSDNLPSWRAACVAYRKVRQRGELDRPAFRAAVTAFRELRPDVSDREAADEVLRAICWAATEHTKWFWRDVHYVKPGPPT